MCLKINPGESEKEYLWRIGNEKSHGLAVRWDEIAECMNEAFHPGSPFGPDTYRKRFANMKKRLDRAITIEPAVYANNLLKREKDETFWEEALVHAVESLKPLKAPSAISCNHLWTNDAYILAFGDCHFGYEFEVNNLSGGIINKYSEEIFVERMEKLLQEALNICATNHIKKLSVMELGDSIHGILRLNSSLMNLRYGILESAVRYADYLADWLNRLSEQVKIEYYPVGDSNHNQLRICSGKKNSFPEENVSIIINTIIDLKLASNPNFNMVKNPTGKAFLDLSGYKILGIHGEIKDLERGIAELSQMYGESIDYLICGHCHHKTQKDIAIDSEVITVRSVMGADPYGASLRKVSAPGASMIGFRKGQGKFVEYNIDLR